MTESANLGFHLTELRRRLTWSAIVLFSITVIAFVFHQQILQILMAPAGNFTDLPQNKPVYTDLTEFIGIAMKASLFVGFFLSLPFLLWQMVMFVSPGLKPTEKKYLYSLLPISILEFLIGAMIRIGNYVNLMISLLFWMGIVFELPIVLFFLSRIGVVSPQFLSKNRRWAIVLAFVLGALITPTLDPINQAFVAGPIVVLYEVGVQLSKLGA